MGRLRAHLKPHAAPRFGRPSVLRLTRETPGTHSQSRAMRMHRIREIRRGTHAWCTALCTFTLSLLGPVGVRMVDPRAHRRVALCGPPQAAAWGPDTLQAGSKDRLWHRTERASMVRLRGWLTIARE